MDDLPKKILHLIFKSFKQNVFYFVTYNFSDTYQIKNCSGRFDSVNLVF